MDFHHGRKWGGNMSAGLDRVRAKLRRHAKAAIEAGRREAAVQGGIIAAMARSFAPQAEGDLIASIRVEAANKVTFGNGVTSDFIGVVVRAGDESTIVVGKNGQKFQNAKLQENGTQTMPANPYFNPAKRMRRRPAKNAIARAVRKGWKAGR